MCAFPEQVAAGNAHGDLVRYDRNCPIDERERLYKQARRRMRAFARARGPDIGDKEAVGLEMLRAALEADGLPDSGWLRHPLPTLQEPNKDVRRITPTPNMEPGDTARLHVGASLGRVDNVFELTRRFMSARERPFYTPSGGCNQVWYGHAPYNPDMVRKYLDIFQAVNNFIHTGADGVTPAMRLGFADRPLAYADVVWSGRARRSPFPNSAAATSPAGLFEAA